MGNSVLDRKESREATMRVWAHMSARQIEQLPVTYRGIAKACAPPYGVSGISYHITKLIDAGYVERREGTKLSGAQLEVLVPLLPLMVRKEVS